MIPRTADLGKDNNHQIPDWNAEMAQAVSDPVELLSILELDQSLFLDNARLASREFSIRVPRGYIARMKKGDPNDPLLKQVLPLDLELADVAGFVTDPVSDQAAMVTPGILQKYHGRALLITTGACAIHCRYCFRRYFPYTYAGVSQNDWSSTLEYIASNQEITEVILSGGDPLSLSDKRLSGLIHEIEKIAHVTRLRIHTRLPVVLPERINESLVQILHSSRLTPVMVIHANHPNEINTPVSQALNMLTEKGIRILNQSVLLKGVNDHSETLIKLSETLFDSGVLPYYLHLLDKVAGAAHFEVAEMDAIKLMESLNARLPGYLVPKLVREIPGATGKTPITG